MSNRKAFVFYKEWKEAIKDLPDDIRLEIYESIIEYATTGDIQGLKPMAKVAFNFIKADIDRDIEKYMSMAERNKNNGHKGGRPKTSNNPKNPVGFSRTQNNPDKPKKAVEEEVEEEVEDKEEDYISPLSPNGDISPGKTVSDNLENEIPDNPPKPPEGEKEKSCAKKEKEPNYSFEEFWDVYDKKVGKKELLIKKWLKLSDEERELAMSYIPKYKLSQPDKQYRKNPETFLNNKSWNDELIFKENLNENRQLPANNPQTTGRYNNPSSRSDAENKRTERNNLNQMAIAILRNTQASDS